MAGGVGRGAVGRGAGPGSGVLRAEREGGVCICYTHAHKSQPSSAAEAAFHRATSIELIQQTHPCCTFTFMYIGTLLESVCEREKALSKEANGGPRLTVSVCVIWCGLSLLCNNRNSGCAHMHIDGGGHLQTPAKVKVQALCWRCALLCR